MPAALWHLIQGMSNNRMIEYAEELKIAEKFLVETIEADRAGDYEGFIRRFDKRDLEGFYEEDFNKDIKLMREQLGAFKSRSYMGSLKGFQNEKHPSCLRFVWRATYEKSEVLIIIGIHKIGDVWYLNESTVSK